MENHAQRPEIAEASRRHSEVLIRRYSTTTEYDTLYAALSNRPSAVAFVRLSLPLTEIAQQQRAILLLALGGVGTALPVAALLAWLALRSARRAASRPSPRWRAAMPPAT